MRVLLAIIIISKVQHVSVNYPRDKDGDHDRHIRNNVLHNALRIVEHTQNRKSKSFLKNQEDEEYLAPEDDRNAAASVRSSPDFSNNDNNSKENKRHTEPAANLLGS